jgi:hypothetical protein
MLIMSGDDIEFVKLSGTQQLQKYRTQALLNEWYSYNCQSFPLKKAVKILWLLFIQVPSVGETVIGYRGLT